MEQGDFEPLFRWIKSKIDHIIELFWEKRPYGVYKLSMSWEYNDIRIFTYARCFDNKHSYRLFPAVEIELKSLSLDEFLKKYGGKRLLCSPYGSLDISIPKDEVELEIESVI